MHRLTKNFTLCTDRSGS